MAKVDVLDAGGKKVGSRELAAEIFEVDVSVPLMHQVVVAGLAAQQAGTHSTKTRGEVSGGGRKPWRQKGTGRARHGSIRSPIWTGGGVAHGPQPRDHDLRVNKKMKRGALRSALSDALASGKIAVVADLSFDEPKTKEAAEVLEALRLAGRILLVLPEPDGQENVALSFRNLPSVRIGFSGGLGAYEVVAADRVLFTQAALDRLEGKGSAPAPSAPSDEGGETE
ncbi:MAG TPA: 50S ribosomal protein L4 [Actinomycetota bacterium]|uniref:Large ribosomal subunit protein uL4 n=1 Tax=uncultured actinobacterium Rifle_16ft_4_minimus_12599 TaxID=1665144 RepID=A0A0H4T2Q5_9ACTN|nr:50S ribosomal protein L4 [uncultured actinobacterium Rifle_16ft_4_minimus_12599]HLB62116.1 50S ribosomal protein L4 [Actinomycetota bacterium]